MAKKTTKRAGQEAVEKPTEANSTSSIPSTVGKSYKARRKVKGHLAAQRLFITKDDAKKLEAINAEFLCESSSRAARLAIKRWHRRLVHLKQRTGAAPADVARPEFSIKIGPGSGGISTTVYMPKEDMDRLNHLAELTGQRAGIGQLIRASIGWLYENLDQ